MPTKSSTPDPSERFHKYAGAHHYAQLATITTGLFVGVLALMTFLLTAGLQHPQPLFSWFIYIAIVALPLNLIVFTIGHSLQQQAINAPEVKDKDKTSSWTGLRVMRLIQQVIFVLSIIAVTGLALVSAHIFFSPAPAAAAQQQTQQAQ